MQNKALTVIKHVVWGIFLAIFAFIAIVAVWISIDKFILKSPVPSMFGYSSLTVKTGSMAGTIEIGDMIIIKDKDEYKIGDVVTYLHENDSIPTTHRIIGKNSDGSFITKGDSNNAKDPEPVSEDIILGEVIKVIPDVGVFAAWIQSEGWIYIVAVLAIVGLGLFILSSGDDEDEEAEKKEETAGEEKDNAEENDSDESDSDENSSDEAKGEEEETKAEDEANGENEASKGFFSKLKFKSKANAAAEAVKNLENTTEEVNASVEELTTAISIMTAAVAQMTAVVTEMSALRQQREALNQAENQEQAPITESASSDEAIERNTSANTDGDISEETAAEEGSHESIANEENISSEDGNTAKV